MFKDIAWNSFYKTGDINSFLEYTKLKQIELSKDFSNTNNVIRNLGVMLDETNKGQGNCDKGSTL